MQQKPDNEWYGFLRVSTLATTCIQNVQQLYKKIVYEKNEPVGFYSEIIREWEQFVEICFEMLGERVEPFVLVLECARAFYRLREYIAFLSLGIDVHINKASYEDYKAQLQERLMRVRLAGDKSLPKLASFIFHQGFSKQLHEINERIVSERVARNGGLTGKLRVLLRALIEKPWRLGEVLRLLRPLILMLLMRSRSGRSSIIPLVTGMGIDLFSILSLHMRMDKSSEIDKIAMKRRCMGLFRYIMYSPIHEFLLAQLSAYLSPQSVFVAMLSYYKCYSHNL